MADEHHQPFIEVAPDITRVGEGYVPTYVAGLITIGTITGIALAGDTFLHRFPEAAFVMARQAEVTQITEILDVFIRNPAVVAEMGAGGIAVGLAAMMGIIAEKFHRFSKEIVSKGRQAIDEAQKLSKDIQADEKYDEKSIMGQIFSTESLWRFEHQVLKREAKRQAN